MAYSYSYAPTLTKGVSDPTQPKPTPTTQPLAPTASQPGSALPPPSTTTPIAPSLFSQFGQQGITAQPATNPTLPTGMAGTNPADTRANVYAYNPVAAPSPTTSATNPALQGLYTALASGAEGLSNLPDRFGLANQQFGTYASQTDPAFQSAIRSATQAATTAGRLGSGMLTTDYGNLAERRAQDLQNERDALFQNALQQSMGDRLNALGAQSGVYGNLSGSDLARQQAAYNQALGSAGFQSGQQGQQLAQNNYTQQFQNTLAQQGIGNAASQYQLQLQAQAQQAAQQQAYLALLGQLGYTTPNTQPLQYQSYQQGQQAQNYANTAGNLFGTLGYGSQPTIPSAPSMQPIYGPVTNPYLYAGQPLTFGG